MAPAGGLSAGSGDGAPAELRAMPIVVGCVNAPAGITTCTPSGPSTVPPSWPDHGRDRRGGVGIHGIIATAGASAAATPQAQANRIVTFHMLHLRCDRSGRSKGL